MSDTKFCTQCGSSIASDAKFCSKCGAEAITGSTSSIQTITASENISEKSAVTTLLLCLFLGSLGIHRFYVGKVKTGILMLLTGGGLGIWALIDLVRIACCDFTDGQGKYLIFRKGRASSLKLILIVVGSVIATLIIYVILLLSLVAYFTSSMMDTVKNQLLALRSGDLDKAYSYMSTETKTDVSINNFKKFMNKYPIMTSNVSTSFPERKVVNNEGYALAILQEKDGKKIIVEYRLIKENDTWKVSSINIKNPKATSIEQTESSNTSYKLYEDKNNHFSIKFPADWGYEQTRKRIVLFSGKNGTASYYSTISIIVVPLKAAGGVYESITSAVNGLKKQISTRYTNVKFIETGEAELPTNPKKYHGEYFTSTYTYKGVAIKSMQFIFSNEGEKELYIWGYTSPAKQYENDLSVAKKMYESWSIE